jgi:hypothetical protein
VPVMREIEERYTTVHYRFELCDIDGCETLGWFTSWTEAAADAERCMRREPKLRLLIADRMARRGHSQKWERFAEGNWRVTVTRPFTQPSPPE